jgi:hypothetical protein
MFSRHSINLERVADVFGDAVRKITLGFTPMDAEGFNVSEYREDDCTLFYIGDDLQAVGTKKLMFPALSHA